MTLFESGLRNRRIEFVVETNEGVTPSDPSWELYSDRVLNFDAAPEVGYEPARGLGDLDPDALERGPEENELTVEYALQRWIVDGSGNAQDASGYGVLRGSDNELQGRTHTVVDREDRSSGGNDSAGVRLYTVVKGAFPDTITYTLDPDTGEPVPCEISYNCEKIRSYAIHQPSSGTTLDIVSTDSNDTMDITIEDEGAGTTETISLNGTTTVTTTASFSDIDAVELASEAAGDVTVSDGSGTTLMTIQGSSSYDGVEGDLGVPALGSGSHASAIGTAFETFLSHQIDRGGSGIATDIVSAEITIENNVESSARSGTFRRRLVGGPRDVMMSADLVSELRSHDALEEHFQGTEDDVVWTADGGSVTLSSAVLTSPGSRAITPDEILLQHSSEFTAQGVSVS